MFPVLSASAGAHQWETNDEFVAAGDIWAVRRQPFGMRKGLPDSIRDCTWTDEGNWLRKSVSDAPTVFYGMEKLKFNVSKDPKVFDIFVKKFLQEKRLEIYSWSGGLGLMQCLDWILSFEFGHSARSAHGVRILGAACLTCDKNFGVWIFLKKFFLTKWLFGCSCSRWCAGFSILRLCDCSFTVFNSFLMRFSRGFLKNCQIVNFLEKLCSVFQKFLKRNSIRVAVAMDVNKTPKVCWNFIPIFSVILFSRAQWRYCWKKVVHVEENLLSEIIVLKR